LRVISWFQPWAFSSLSVFDSWLLAWGSPPPSGQVTFAVNLIDPVSGFAGPSVRASAAYLAVAFQPPAPASILIEFDGTPDAVLTEADVSFNFTPEAGG
jgi:hypothetical protein